MKITVDRTFNDEKELIFVIKVSEPHKAPFGELEQKLCTILDSCKESVNQVTAEDNKLKNNILGTIHYAKEQAFIRVLSSLKFAIKNELKLKFDPMCQEIYNWIFDQQDQPLKKWMQEFDPQRTTFYFDNDNKIEPVKEYSFAEDKFDDEEDEDEE